jgi:hypothetical protein
MRFALVTASYGGLSRTKDRATVGGPDATASGFRRNKRSFLRAYDQLVGSYRRGIDAVNLLSLRDPDVSRPGHPAPPQTGFVA